MTKQEMSRIVQSQLAIDLNCTPDDFYRDGFVFCETRENPGRRPFPRGERHFEMYTMGDAVIVSATLDILPYLREQLDGKSRDEAFDMPFVYGQGICHLPNVERLAFIPTPDGIDIVTVAQRAGFNPAWACVYRGRFDDVLTEPTS